ncbi:dolichyl-phosphate-mannose-proteinmannosyltransferase [Rhizoctonia solani AG-1 IB]|uniref:Dolichyl-phosphate-mannose--protein mannosyltransferase n=1 Tax=Thanatephorus cucumeris (strain AG1-IB / isolate 7/3/14) TaxID=1108050 RepID=M5BYJ9_THACB|nr:dolichyl-phosphate-mannose-proteinmannosyltransferase [Rhizoctonia solani AG-1 IB]
MRLLPAILGVAVVPLTYLTLRGLDCRATTALLGAFLVTFENGLITQSRLILLDSPLIFFTALTAFFWVGFSNEDAQRPFTEEWWTWLALTGLSLGAVVSCKWVGLFTIATVGVCTLRQLWLLLGDLKVTPRLFIKHFMARALCLILLPILFYMAMFEIHFAILQNSGDGDGFMSAAFMHTLGGRGMSDTFADVALGSVVTLRHVNTQGGYLHSHLHTYPGGSKQQQITLYPHIDANNDWRIINGTFDGAADFDWTTEPISQIRNGQTIRFEHIATQKRLHSHDVRPPVSDVDFQNEVSAYGYPGFQGDANDNWIVEIEEGAGRGQTVKTLQTKFRLRHPLTGCYLFSHKVKLPDWAYEQQEVTCNKNAVRENSIWYIETNNHEKLGDDAEKVNYKPPGFLSKFLELQQVMWTTNAGLTDRHAFDSRPSSWPRLRRGINFWVKDHKQIYLIGNPFVWYMSTISVLSYAVFRGFLILREKRGYKDFHNTTLVKYDQLCAFLATGWVLHYFPFFLMSRQLFLHHYFPALYFAILMSCAVFDAVTANLKPRVRLQIAGVVLIFVLWNYMSFSPLTYGTPWTKSKCEGSKWLKTWDFACGDFYENYDQYSTALPSTPSPSAIQPVVVGDEHGGRPAVVADVPQVQKPKEDAQTTDSVIIPIEPGHDVFAGDKGDSKPISSERVVEPLRKEALIHTSDTTGTSPGTDSDVKPEKVPLPKNEGAQSTGKVGQEEELRSIEEETKKKVPAGVQEKIVQAQQNIVEKVAEAKEQLKDHAKAQNEEERVRQELYGDGKKEA